MNTLGLVVFLGLCLANAVPLDSLKASQTRGQPWPAPQSYLTTYSTSVVDNTLVISSNLAACDIIEQAIERYTPYITRADCARATRANSPFKRHQKSEAKISSLYIKVSGPCEKWLTETSDESYTLDVNDDTAKGTARITSQTVWGALRALETFSQLIYNRGDGVLIVNTTQIADFPRFNYRGVLLDTGRHFLPMHVLLENLESMAQNKMNVFHWHIVDDQSFPYVSNAFPNLSKLGAYDQKHVYTPQDVAKVIEFARVRGIRVIPEFDTPGHTLAWGPGEPGLLTPCYSQGRSDGTFGPVNPTVNSTYEFFSKFFAEVALVFSDNYIHLGGDEVSFDCWKSNPDVISFMKSHGMGQNFELLEQYYEQEIVDIMKKIKLSYIVWQEVFDNKVTLDNSTVIHVWKDGYQTELSSVTAAGYRTILSAPWYLNDISYGVNWQKWYTVDPYDFEGTDKQKRLVIGGEACMWGEYVDAVNAMAYTWPTASVVAERLWSSADVNDAGAAAPRLEEQRCRMMKRGLTVEPVNGPGFCTCDIYN